MKKIYEISMFEYGSGKYSYRYCDNLYLAQEYYRGYRTTVECGYACNLIFCQLDTETGERIGLNEWGQPLNDAQESWYLKVYPYRL